MKVLINVSIGELFDKITILRIKQERLSNKEQLENVQKELTVLERKAFYNDPEVNALVDELKKVNELLWDIENSKRLCEANKEFGSKFIELARQVYIQNDNRAKIKKMINVITGSEIIEEKEYTNYL